MGFFDKIGKKKKPQKRERLLHPNDLMKFKSGLVDRRIERSGIKPIGESDDFDAALRNDGETQASSDGEKAENANEETAATLQSEKESSVWALRRSLHQGRFEQAERIMEEAEPESLERLLLCGVRAAWKGKSKEAAEALERVIALAQGDEKAWAHLTLAALALEQSKIESADEQISEARIAAYSLRQTSLAALVNLTEARAALERGDVKTTRRLALEAIEENGDEMLKGYGRYLLGCLGRFRNSDKAECIEHLRCAADAFDAQGDRYLSALARLEMTFCDIDEVEAVGLARETAEELAALGRLKEARTAATRAAALECSAEANAKEFPREAGFIFASPKTIRIRREMNLIAAAGDAPVLILGPRGVGKQLLARAIHDLSPNRDKPFVTINCSLLRENFVESKLFGHEKGAFTDARERKAGYFEEAADGTLFLDEAADLPMEAQQGLLIVLQTGEYNRLGGTTVLKNRARVIAATNKPIEEMMRQGIFREDLYDRLADWVIRVPGLKERKEEILPLAREFLLRFGGPQYRYDRNAEEFLKEINYPGNVRMLEKLIRRACLRAKGNAASVITALTLLESLNMESQDEEPQDMSEERRELKAESLAAEEELPELQTAVAELEKNLLIKSLTRHKGNRTMARTALGVSKTSFWRLCRRHGLESYGEDWDG